MKRSGFILVIVVGLLGVLAYLALHLAEQSRLARKLSLAGLLQAQVRLLARSGIEHGRQAYMLPYLDTNGAHPFGAPYPLPNGSGNPNWAHDKAISVSIPGIDATTVNLEVVMGDANGKICINDGIAAGRAEARSHPASFTPDGYKANALNPWPAGANVMDVSAWINLRLRSLLNAYGDVCRFDSYDPEYPKLWERNDGELPPQPRWTATDAGEHFSPIPPFRLVGGVFEDVTANPRLSRGLGDRIIGSRPSLGYSELGQVREILDAWGREFLKPEWLAELGGSFFEIVEKDFIVESWLDHGFWRMKREFGAENPLWPGHALVHGISQSNCLMDVGATPPDFSDLWQPHPFAPVNLNEASVWVKAAIFHAITNPHFVAEAYEPDTINWPQSGRPLTTFDYDNHGLFSSWYPVLGDRALLGVSVKFVSSNPNYIGTHPEYFERRSNVAEQSDPQVIRDVVAPMQLRRFMSVTAARLYAVSYDAIAQTHGYPDHFEQFAHLLRRAMSSNKYDRFNFDNYGSPPSAYLMNESRWAPSLLLPQFLDCQRRLPGWMGAPVALLSPAGDPGVADPDNANLTPKQSNPYLSSEDFVFRSHLPKATFLPSGKVSVRARADMARGRNEAKHVIRTTLKAFETTVVRDQASFKKITDPASSPEIKIGPEPSLVAPSPFLGTVGLESRGTITPVGGVKKFHAGYNNTIGADPGGNLPFQPSTMDQDIGVVPLEDAGGLGVIDDAGGGRGGIDPPPPPPPPPSPPPLPSHQILQHSDLEGPNHSIFPKAGAPFSNLSPFGGLFFSAMGHGRTATKRFSDSLYFRPNHSLLAPAPNNTIATWGNRGLISCWIRTPHIWGRYAMNHHVFHFTFWENIEARRALDPTILPSSSDPLIVRLAPVEMKFSLGDGFTVYKRNNVHDQSGYRFAPWGTSTLPTLKVLPYPPISGNYQNDMTNFLQNGFYQTGRMFDWPSNHESFYFGTNVIGKNSWYNQMSVFPDDQGGFLKASNSGGRFSRPGGWTRLVAFYDARDYHHILAQATLPNFPVFFSNDSFRVAALQRSSDYLWTDNSVRCPSLQSTKSPLHFELASQSNPAMIMTFGERHVETLENGTISLMPMGRLNSLIDDLSMSFGGFPGDLYPNFTHNVNNFVVNFTSPTPMLESNTQLDGLCRNVFGADYLKRYKIDATYEPAWLINPQLPSGSKILHFGARIYDVPFTPEYGQSGDPKWSSWTVKSPRIDLDLVQAGAVVPPSRQSLEVKEYDIVTKSPAWKFYADRVSATPTTRLRLTYRNVDTNGDPLGPLLTDIPYIQEVSWRWIPPGGMKVLSWEQE